MNTVTGNTIVEKIIPVLPSLDFDKSIEFYTKKLGFDLIFRTEGRLGLAKQGIGIHMWHCSDANIPKNSSCFVIVSNIDALYEEYEKQGVIHPNGKLEVKPWNMKQFAILDNDGNLLEIAEYI